MRKRVGTPHSIISKNVQIALPLNQEMLRKLVASTFCSCGPPMAAGRIPQTQQRSEAKGAMRIAETWTLSERSEFVQVSILGDRA